MENFKLPEGLVELKLNEMELISGGNGIFYRLGTRFHQAYCSLRDWANEYEGIPISDSKWAGYKVDIASGLDKIFLLKKAVSYGPTRTTQEKTKSKRQINFK